MWVKCESTRIGSDRFDPRTPNKQILHPLCVKHLWLRTPNLKLDTDWKVHSKT